MALIKVRDKQTGKIFEVPEEELASYGLQQPTYKSMSGNLKDYIYSEKKAPLAEKMQEGGGLSSFLGGAIKPFESGARYLFGSSAALGQILGGKGQEVAGDKNLPFLTQEQEAGLRSPEPYSAMGEGAKRGAGLASYGFGPGKGWQAALTGFLRGGLVGASEDKATPKSTVESAASGSAVELILANAVSFLGKKGKGFLTRSNIKKLGKPTMSEGGVPAIDEWKDLDFDTNSLDSLDSSADSYISNNGPSIANISDDLSNKGVNVTKKEVMGFLNKKLDQAATAETKVPINRVIRNTEKTFGDRESVPLSEFYNMKKDWGQLGRWSETAPPKDQQIAAVYNDLYIEANNIIDNAFKSGLPENQASIFRDINRGLNAAYDIKHFVSRINLVTTPGGLPAGFNATLKAILDSPAVLDALGKTFSTISKTPEPISNLLTKGAVISMSDKKEKK